MAVATPGQVPSVPAEPPALSLEEARRGRWPSWMQPVVRRLSDHGLRWWTGFAALLPVAALIAIITVLAIKAFPAMKYNGVGFLFRDTWRPGST
jgi:hypothetical protein